MEEGALRDRVAATRRPAAALRAAGVALLALAGGPPDAAAQERESQRPVVGLVLGGGGARGFAHLGVLRVLHEHRIPVDRIAGTSMGAVVGGLYAAGLPVDELERLFGERDWRELLDDDPPRARLRLRRKRERRDLLLPVRVGVGLGGVRLPSGLFSAGELLAFLQARTLHVRGDPSFDALPVPFRAVATDLESGREVVLDRASLATAIRASLAIPGFFSPVRIGGRTLVDGGLVNNLPVDVARGMGAEVIIAVHVARPLREKGRASALEVADRAITILMRRWTLAQRETLGAEDVLLRPSLGEVRRADFDDFETAYEAGRRVAEAALPRLRRLALVPEAFRAWDRARTARWSPDVGIPAEFVRVDTSATSLAPEVVRAAFSAAPDGSIGPDALERGVVDVLGYGGFESVPVEAVRAGGRSGLLLRPRDEPWGPGILGAGLVLSDRQRGRARWGLEARWIRSRLNARGGELRLGVAAGSDQRLRVELYQPLDAAETLFVGTEAAVERRDDLLPRPSGGEESVDVSDVGLSLSSGLRLEHWGELRLGLRRSRLDVDRITGPDTALPDALDLTSWLGRLEVDVLDRVPFPSRGVLGSVDLRLARPWMGGEASFERLEARAIGALSRGRHTLRLGGLIGSSLGSDPPRASEFRLGGLFRLTGAEPGSVRGAYAGALHAVYYLRPRAPAAKTGGAPLRIGAALEAGNAWSTVDAVDLDDLLWSASLLVALDTPLGPAHAGWTWTRRRSPGWFLAVGPSL